MKQCLFKELIPVIFLSNPLKPCHIIMSFPKYNVYRHNENKYTYLLLRTNPSYELHVALCSDFQTASCHSHE